MKVRVVSDAMRAAAPLGGCGDDRSTSQESSSVWARRRALGPSYGVDDEWDELRERLERLRSIADGLDGGVGSVSP